MKILVWCGSSNDLDDDYLQSAAKLGCAIAQHGHTLVYGGCNTGLMGAVADGALMADGEVIGVLVDSPKIQARRHPALTRYIESADLAERKRIMCEIADAYVALPGGIGTLDELGDALSLARLGAEEKPIALFDEFGFYELLLSFFDSLVKKGFASEEDFRSFGCFSEIEPLFDFISK